MDSDKVADRTTPLQPANVGLAGALRLAMIQHVRDSMMPLSDTLVFEARAISGGRSITIRIDQPSPYTLVCEDEAVVAAGRTIRRGDDLNVVLDYFTGIEWHQDDDGAYLFTQTRDFSRLASLALSMRDAALALIAYAEAMKNHGIGAHRA